MTVSVGFWREGVTVPVACGAHGSGTPNAMKDPFVALKALKDPFVALDVMKDPFITSGSGVAR